MDTQLLQKSEHNKTMWIKFTDFFIAKIRKMPTKTQNHLFLAFIYTTFGARYMCGQSNN